MKNKFILIIVAMLFNGCASFAAIKHAYPGNELPSNQLAIITGISQGNPFALFDTAYITKVDGNELEGDGLKVAVLPGTRELEIFCHTGAPYRNGTTTIVFNFEAGHKYAIYLGVDDKRCSVSVVDNS